MSIFSALFRLLCAVLYWRLRDAGQFKIARRPHLYRLPTRRDPGGVIQF